MRGLFFCLIIGFQVLPSPWASVRYNYTWQQLLEEGKSVHPGHDFGLTWGAEKEGSTAILTRVASPSGATLRNFLETLSPANQTRFLRDFFTHYHESGDYRVEGEVRDIHGNIKAISWEQIGLRNAERASPDILERAWQAWIVMTDDSPFSFLHPKVRRWIFNGDMPGLKNRGFKSRRFYFDKPWRPIFGQAQRYIEAVYKDGKSWEIHFRPQKSYGEFEGMIRWFREELKTGDRLFGAPGHQRIVFPRVSGFNDEKAAELFKTLQALIATDAIERESDVPDTVVWKRVHADAGDWEERGILRTEPRRWGEGLYGIEFRRGMKNVPLRRFVLTVTASRVIEGHWDDLEDASSWVLVRPWPHDLQNLENRFGLDRQTVRLAQYHWEEYLPEFHHLYYAPLWNWQDAPFLSREKKQQLRELAKKFVQDSARTPMGRQKMLRLVAQWASRSEVVTDLKYYASPRGASCRQLARGIL